jgi:hypothetical protein
MPYSLERKAVSMKKTVKASIGKHRKDDYGRWRSLAWDEYAAKPRRKNKVQSTSARPTSPATASQCTGWTAKSSPASNESLPAIRATKDVTTQWSNTLMRCCQNGSLWPPVQRNDKTTSGRKEPWEPEEFNRVPQKSYWNASPIGLSPLTSSFLSIALLN